MQSFFAFGNADKYLRASIIEFHPWSSGATKPTYD
jgi:hypothetical protein